MALKPCKECGREISTEATVCPHCGRKNPTGIHTPPAAWGCLALILIGFVGFVSIMLSSDGASSSDSAAKSLSPFEQAMAQVKLDYTWGTGASDLVMIANFTITNPTPHRIKDVEITCTHYAPSGTRIDSNKRTIYEVVPAKGRKRIREFNMGFIHSQAESTACKITNLVVG